MSDNIMITKCENCNRYLNCQRCNAQYCSEKCRKNAKYKRRINQGLCYRCSCKVTDINPVTNKPFNRCRYHREKHKAIANRSYLNNIESHRYKNKQRADYMRNWLQKRAVKARLKLFEMYGNECSCCGESAKEFLTLDHIDGGSHDHKLKVGRKTYRIHEDACKEYRPDLFQVLCMNCNWSIGQFGYCPHRVEH
jgi:hypothetical protein